MKFETVGEKTNPAVLFFHVMGVTGASILAEAGGNRTGTCGGISRVLMPLNFCAWILKLTENAEAEYNTHIVKWFEKSRYEGKL